MQNIKNEKRKNIKSTKKRKGAKTTNTSGWFI